MARVFRLVKGTSGFPSASYREVGGQTTDAYITATAALGVPAAPTITVVGAAGVVAYSYRITALSVSGSGVTGETTVGVAGTTATGNAALSGTNFNRVSWAAVVGATSYRVYGRVAAGELLMATIAVTAPGGTTKVSGGTINGVASGDGFDDTGAITPAGAQPASNTAKTFTARVPMLRQGPSGGTNWVKTGLTINTLRNQTNVLVQGR